VDQQNDAGISSRALAAFAGPSLSAIDVPCQTERLADCSLCRPIPSNATIDYVHTLDAEGKHDGDTELP
jgi:hypothetical protein